MLTPGTRVTASAMLRDQGVIVETAQAVRSTAPRARLRDSPGVLTSRAALPVTRLTTTDRALTSRVTTLETRTLTMPAMLTGGLLMLGRVLTVPTVPVPIMLRRLTGTTTVPITLPTRTLRVVTTTISHLAVLVDPMALVDLVMERGATDLAVDLAMVVGVPVMERGVTDLAVEVRVTPGMRRVTISWSRPTPRPVRPCSVVSVSKRLTSPFKMISYR